jgi:hypothetical protein
MQLSQRLAEFRHLSTLDMPWNDAETVCGCLRGQDFEGAKPADLLVQQESKFEVVINSKAAKRSV